MSAALAIETDIEIERLVRYCPRHAPEFLIVPTTSGEDTVILQRCIRAGSRFGEKVTGQVNL